MTAPSRVLVIAALASLLLLPACGPQDFRASAAAPPFDGSFSVLTYNIKGSAWPIAWGRPAAFAAIAARLRALRRAHRNPQIVVFQEAFSDAARAIGREAGYRYVIDGPPADESDPAPMTQADRAFARGAHWWLGETQNKVVGSGLQALSDHPVIRVRRMAYPAFACAGYDCLANKGALLVTVRIPGAPSPVDVVTTHLNSRHSSGVPDARSLYAYRRQTEFLSAFIDRWHDPAFPLVAAGDFNVGRARPRWAALRSELADWPDPPAIRDAIGQVVARDHAQGLPLPRDVPAVMRHGADWEFFESGRRALIRAIAISVPFGREADGSMLSDHMGYAAQYRLDTPRRAAPIETAAAARPRPISRAG